MSHIIILRFSAMGDVLMALPVIDAVARHNADVRFTLVSRAWAKPLARLLPGNVSFITADLSGKHKGLRGLNRLCRRLMALHPTAVADLHDVLRTQWLRLRFALVGVPVAAIRKGRRDRRRFVATHGAVCQRPVFERYADVFRRLGLAFDMDFRSLMPPGGADLSAAIPAFAAAQHPERHWVGVAPFAAHAGKVYPPELMEQVVERLAARGDTRVFLFGAGERERQVLEAWEQRYAHVESVAGRLGGIAQELALVSHLRVMVSMDSANMHLASLAAVPVVSVWGATHPHGGFLGYGQSTAHAVQLDLDCRPCSTYGQKPCLHGDYRCLRGIHPADIADRVEAIITHAATP